MQIPFPRPANTPLFWYWFDWVKVGKLCLFQYDCFIGAQIDMMNDVETSRTMIERADEIEDQNSKDHSSSKPIS